MSGERGESESWNVWEVESERGIEKEQGEGESVEGREGMERVRVRGRKGRVRGESVAKVRGRKGKVRRDRVGGVSVKE